MFQTYQKESARIRFDPKEVSHFLSGGKREYEEWQKKLAKYTGDLWDPNLFNQSRVDRMKQAIRELPALAGPIDFRDPETIGAVSMIEQCQTPGSAHIIMFMVAIDLMGTETQRKEFLPKCMTYEIVGCYVQTQIAHGSDVQSLQTTATLDTEKDEFVLNTPSLEAAKYWVGDLGWFSNWALVHARCIINGKDNGIQNFLVQIRDENHNPMPGVELGEIGPKWGWLTKDNGYLIMKNVRIPRKNMLRKYAKIENGTLSKRGNPKVGYATMMTVRRLLSGHATKVYAQALTIAGKYSFARRQFKDDKKQEIPIINYQLQQNKLISCLAEHFAIEMGGNKVNKMTQLNIQMVNNDDDSLMQETHNCLCLTKALFTQYCLRGVEICRIACGGHGFSHYSGLPHVVQHFSPNVTLEGENTVMYLQVARYVLKAYQNSLSKKKPLGESVKYIDSFEQLMGTKCQVGSAQEWSIESVRLLLAKSVLVLITSCTEKLMSDQNQKNAWNFKAGLRLQQLAHSHAVYWTFNSFVQALGVFSGSQEAKGVISDLCLLLGINALLSKPQPLIENVLVTPSQMTTLQQRKEILLKSLRGNFVGLIQSLGVPKIYERSALTYGDVYKNMLELAKKNPINSEIPPAVDVIKKGLSNTRPRL